MELAFTRSTTTAITSCTGPLRCGDLPPDRQVPIYVGKAVPAGARKGNFGVDDEPGKVLFSRLTEHARSIEQAEDLNIDDFGCRFIVVDDIWIPLGESLLIARFSPVWNKIVDGFGNHDPGGGRYRQKRSRWDTLHPGRSWALKCAEREETVDQIALDVARHLVDTPPPPPDGLFREA